MTRTAPLVYGNKLAEWAMKYRHNYIAVRGGFSYCKVRVTRGQLKSIRYPVNDDRMFDVSLTVEGSEDARAMYGCNFYPDSDRIKVVF